jgi:hypothetical protein
VRSRAWWTIALLAALGTVSCGEPTAASWRVRFVGDGGVVGASAVRIQLRVFSGDCTSTALVYRADVARTDAIPLFGEIGEGALAFQATALDATCTVVARGCTATSLPLAMGDEIVTQLEAVSGEAPLCAASACMDGFCPPGSTDGGVGDGAAGDGAAGDGAADAM